MKKAPQNQFIESFLIYLESLSVPDLLLAEFLEAGRCHEHCVRLEVRIPQNLQRLRVQVQHADLTRVYYFPDSFERCTWMEKEDI